MPYRAHYDIVDLAKIPLVSIRDFSLATTDSEHETIAQEIAQQYGVPGLRTLWLCQGLDCSTRSVSVAPPGQEGITRAARWWLESNSNAATALKKDFAAVTELHDANLLLGMCTRTPQFNIQAPESNLMFSPGDCEDTPSLLRAIHVRRLARTYFAHLPDVASPLNHLYFGCCESNDDERQWDSIYTDPMGAFLDDEHALKFFAASERPLPLNPPPWLLDFAKRGDTEWNLYKELGIPMEQAYRLAVQNAAAPKECLALPVDLNPMDV